MKNLIDTFGVAIPPQIRILLLGIICLAIFAAGWQTNGWRLGMKMETMKKEYASAVLEAQEAAIEVERLSGDLADANGKLAAQKLKKEDQKTKVIVKEVIRYASENRNNGFRLPAGWVRIDTASAAGVPTDAVPIAGADDATTAFTDVDLLSTVTERNAVCRTEIAKLESLQAYVREQLALFNGDGPKKNNGPGGPLAVRLVNQSVVAATSAELMQRSVVGHKALNPKLATLWGHDRALTFGV